MSSESVSVVSKLTVKRSLGFLAFCTRIVNVNHNVLFLCKAITVYLLAYNYTDNSIFLSFYINGPMPCYL